MINVNGTINVRQIINQPGSIYNGKLQEKYNVVLKAWLARDGDGKLHLLLNTSDDDMFLRSGNRENDVWYMVRGYCDDIELDQDLFPDVKWEDDYPTEVQLKIM